jgi:hypothetical protein
MATDSAIAEIQRRFRLFNVEVPVARLYEKSDATALFSDAEKIELSQSRADDQVRALAKERVSTNTLRSAIEVGVSERKLFRDEDLIEVGEVAFVLGEDFYRMLDDCTLTFQDGRFVLLDAQGTSQTILSLAKRVGRTGRS